MKNSKHDDLCQVSSSKVDHTGLLIEEIQVCQSRKALNYIPLTVK